MIYYFFICAAGVPNLAMVESVDDEKVKYFYHKGIILINFKMSWFWLLTF